jgi:hypothetical protein
MIILFYEAAMQRSLLALVEDSNAFQNLDQMNYMEAVQTIDVMKRSFKRIFKLFCDGEPLTRLQRDFILSMNSAMLAHRRITSSTGS